MREREGERERGSITLHKNVREVEQILCKELFAKETKGKIVRLVYMGVKHGL
jgi:hypothetical protein